MFHFGAGSFLAFVVVVTAGILLLFLFLFFFLFREVLFLENYKISGKIFLIKVSTFQTSSSERHIKLFLGTVFVSQEGKGK